MKYLIDTNILIYYFNGKLNPKQRSLIENIFDVSFNISIITKIEFLGWQRHTDSTFKLASEFLRNAEIVPIEDDIVNLSIDLKRNKKIKIADAIISATAIFYNSTLLTRNTKDFEGIEKIKILNPFSE